MNSMLRFLILSFLITTITIAQVKETNTDWNAIKGSDGKIALNQVKDWGSDMNDLEEAFRNPSDICIDKEGNYYISDAGKNEILVYDKNGKLKKRIGKNGQGPGDFGYPASIKIDNNNNLVVSESINVH